MKLHTARGVYDSLPKDALRRQRIITTIRAILESFGFSPMESPAFERFSVLAATSSPEQLKEVFSFYDASKRKLALRTNHIIPLARMLATTPELKLPFKRYVLDKLWKDDAVNPSSSREHTVVDLDVIGVKTAMAEAELIAVVARILAALDIPYRVRVNSVKVLRALLRHDGVPDAMLPVALECIARKDLREATVMRQDMINIGIAETVANDIVFWLYGRMTLDEIKQLFSDEEGTQGVEDINAVIACAQRFGHSLVFDIGLCNQAAKYTTMLDIQGSDTLQRFAIGGRYSGVITALVGTSQPVHAAGVTMQVDHIIEAAGNTGVAETRTVTHAFIISLVDGDNDIILAQQLREHGICVETDLLSRGISKNLQYVNALGIPYALVIGPQELAQRAVQLKDMTTGEQSIVSQKDIVSLLKSKLGL